MTIKTISIKLNSPVVHISNYEDRVYCMYTDTYITLKDYWKSICRGYLGYRRTGENSFILTYEVDE